MIRKLLSLTLVLLALSSCQSDENQIPSIPDHQLIDVDNDGVDDFLIKYNHASIYSPTSTEGILCELEILGNNETLVKEGAPFLFLDDVNMIAEDVNSPLRWSSVDSHIATFEKHFEDGWPANWKISTTKNRTSYFIGIKLNIDSHSEIGWVEFEVDDNSGIVTIVEKKIL